MSEPLNTHGVIMQVGRHKGTPFTRLPVSYLKWMVNARHGQADLAAAELSRRGTTTPDLEVSGHAIDRASLSCRKTWHETRGEDEGMHEVEWELKLWMEGVGPKPEGVVVCRDHSHD